jgi:hypothetical protein
MTNTAMLTSGALSAFLALSTPLAAQTQTYPVTNITGAMTFMHTVNAQQVAQTSISSTSLFAATLNLAESPKARNRFAPPRLRSSRFAATSLAPIVTAPTQLLPVVAGPVKTSFVGLSHLDQRLANGGNQFSVEPPNPSIAVANGYVLEGVNNAVQVYTTTGSPLLIKVISSNELFGVAPAINRDNGVNGVFPTDMRVFFDGGMNRWFVLQRAQDYDVAGNALNTSRIYLAVSKTADPLGVYNIYAMDTTNSTNPGCPCVADYPQIGADAYGFHIGVNEFTTTTQNFVDAAIFSISKNSLTTGATTPVVTRVLLPFQSGYEFAIQPATTPPGASNFLGSGGVEFFVSTVASYAAGTNVAVWSMSNTSSLSSSRPSLTLVRTVIPSMQYTNPDSATQPEGYRPYGTSLNPPGPLPLIDGGDTRVQALYYAGGRLHLTFAAKVTQASGSNVVGAAYMVLAPTLRGTALAAQVIRQRMFAVANHHLLRPSIGIDSQGRGAIAATLVGPEWYPSAAFLPIEPVAGNASMVRVAAAGTLPEDGFTGYAGSTQTVSRWGDYSSTAIANDGSVWMVAQYIGSSPRTAFANWGTFIMSTKL